MTPLQNITTSKDDEETKTKTFAILKNVKNVTPPKASPDELKENAKLSPPTPDNDDDSDSDDKKSASKYNIFPSKEAGSHFACKTDKVKGYKCPNCQRSYNARRNLVRHVTLECGRDPQYKCPYCSYSKHRRNELKNHIKKKHPNQNDRSHK